MKTCKKCYYYSIINMKCKRFMIEVPDADVFGTACKEYSEKKIKKVQCYDCINLNKYKYCLMKKKCLDDTEIKRLKQCRYYFKRKRRKLK